MTTSQDQPAQRRFVLRMIDWERIRFRLERYPAIERAFPLETLEAHCESSPYYCHYMAWRLGTWQDESPFQRLEELLDCAETLPHWEHEKRSLVGSAEFGLFWSLIWQLQVAEHLCKVGTNVSWGESGPDLSLKIGDQRWFVECYTYRKSFDLLFFLEELLRKLDPAACTDYDLCLPFRLPQNSDRTEFLHEILSPFLDPALLENAKENAKRKYPVMICKHPSSSFCVYVEGNDCGAYAPNIVPNKVGNPASYLQVALQEAVCAKQNSNELKNLHPNIVAVNYSLSADYQVAKNLPERVQSRTLPEIEPNIDVLAASAIGMNERLSREELEVVRVSGSHVICSHLNQIAALPGSGTQSG